MASQKFLALSVVTRALGKTRYRYSELRPKAEKGIAAKITENQVPDIDDDSQPVNASFDSEISPTPWESDAASSQKPEKKKKLKRLRKPNLSLFEEVVDEKAMLEAEVNDMINKDHYYDVVEPYDAGQQIARKRKKKNNLILVGLLAGVVLTVAYIIWTLGGIFQ